MARLARQVPRKRGQSGPRLRQGRLSSQMTRSWAAGRSCPSRLQFSSYILMIRAGPGSTPARPSPAPPPPGTRSGTASSPRPWAAASARAGPASLPGQRQSASRRTLSLPCAARSRRCPLLFSARLWARAGAGSSEAGLGLGAGPGVGLEVGEGEPGCLAGPAFQLL